MCHSDGWLTWWENQLKPCHGIISSRLPQLRKRPYLKLVTCHYQHVSINQVRIARNQASFLFRLVCPVFEAYYSSGLRAELLPQTSRSFLLCRSRTTVDSGARRARPMMLDQGKYKHVVVTKRKVHGGRHEITSLLLVRDEKVKGISRRSVPT